MVKVSTFIIGIVIASAFMLLAGGLMTNLESNTNADFENIDLSEYSALDDISSNYTEAAMEDAYGLKEKPNAIDVIGAYFSDAYNALKALPASLSFTKDMIDLASTQVYTGQQGEVLRKAGITIIIILLILGVLISALLKVSI